MFKLTGASSLVGVIGSGRGGYGDNSSVSSAVNPWAVNEGVAINTGVVATVLTASYNYGTVAGFNENNTQFTEWTIPLTALGVTGSSGSFAMHMTWECGNDVINSFATFSGPSVPEPVTLVGLMLSLGGVGRYLRRRAAA